MARGFQLLCYAMSNTAWTVKLDIFSKSAIGFCYKYIRAKALKLLNHFAMFILLSSMMKKVYTFDCPNGIAILHCTAMLALSFLSL